MAEEKVRYSDEELAEFKTIIESDPDFPGVAFRDVTVRLRAIRPEGTFLTPEEFDELFHPEEMI